MSKIHALFIVAVATGFLAGCGDDATNGEPVGQACEPDTELSPESCWVNDKERLKIESPEGFEKVCNSPCTKAKSLWISSVDGLTDLRPLRRLTHIGGLELSDNPDLKSLDGLDNLETMVGIGLTNNNSLVNLEGLEAIERLDGRLTVEKNENLRSLKGLDNVRSMGKKVGNSIIQVFSNPRLREIGSLDKLEVVHGHLNLQENHAMTRINGFGSLERVVQGFGISGHNSLKSVTSIKNLTEVGGNFDAQSNPKLPRCQIQEILDRLEDFDGETYMSGLGSGSCE